MWASLVAQRICLYCGIPGFDPRVRKIPWRRKWQPTPVHLPGKFRGLQSMGSQRVRYNWATLDFLNLTEGWTLTFAKTFLEWQHLITPDITVFHSISVALLEPACPCRRRRRRGFDPWVGKIPWRRAWQPTPVFLPGESHGQSSLGGHSPWGHKESDLTEAT